MFKLGASGRVSFVEFVNAWLVAGLVSYGMGTVLWIIALSRASLTLVYPFTALTFVLVYGAGVMLLGEPVPVRAWIGILLILCGLFLISST